MIKTIKIEIDLDMGGETESPFDSKLLDFRAMEITAEEVDHLVSRMSDNTEICRFADVKTARVTVGEEARTKEFGWR